MTRAACVAIACAWAATNAVDAQTAGGRYAEALEAELIALGLSAQCRAPSPSAYDCTYPARSAMDKQDLTAHAHYDDTTDTVYVYVSLLSMPANSPALPAVLRRAMELNWELLSTKLEWNAQAGELRMSGLLHTDSNFDRRALRALVRSLDRTIVRHYLQLSGLAAESGSAH